MAREAWRGPAGGPRAVQPLLLAELAPAAAARALGRGVAALDEALLAPQAWGVGRAAALACARQLDVLRGRRRRVAERRVDEAEAAQRQAVGAMWTAPLTTARAEAALWDSRPGRRRATLVDTLRWRLATRSDDMAAFYLAPVLAVGARAEADLATRRRATGDAEAEARGSARARARAGQGRREPGDAPPEALLQLATAVAEAQRAPVVLRTPATWADLAARWEAFGVPVPAAYARWRQAEATLAERGRAGATSPRRCPPRTRWPCGSARGLCGRSSKRWRGARESRSSAAMPPSRPTRP